MHGRAHTLTHTHARTCTQSKALIENPTSKSNFPRSTEVPPSVIASAREAMLARKLAPAEDNGGVTGKGGDDGAKIDPIPA